MSDQSFKRWAAEHPLLNNVEVARQAVSGKLDREQLDVLHNAPVKRPRKKKATNQVSIYDVIKEGK